MNGIAIPPGLAVSCLSASCVHQRRAEGRLCVAEVSYPDHIDKGDLRIEGTSDLPRVGDARDENTLWVADFSGDPFWREECGDRRIRRAEMMLTLKVTGGAHSDALHVGGVLFRDKFPEFRVPPGNTSWIDEDFVLANDDSEVLDGLMAALREGEGILAIRYSADATISEARLETGTDGAVREGDPSG